MMSKINFKKLMENCPEDVAERFTDWFIRLARDILEINKWEEDERTDIYGALCKLDLFYVNWNIRNDYCIKTYKAQLSDSPVYAVYVSKIINIFDCSYQYFAFVNYPSRYLYRMFTIPIIKSESFNSLFGDIMISVNYEKMEENPALTLNLEEPILRFDKICSTLAESIYR